MNFKKILSAVGLLTVAIPASLSVVACSGPSQPAKSNNLNTLLKVKQVNGTEANTEPTVLAKVIELNPNAKLTTNDIQIKAGTFTAATAGTAGSATIVAKDNTKYTGEAKITITALPQDLNTLIQTKQVAGTDANTEPTVLAKVIELNPNAKLTTNDIQIKAGTFKAAAAGTAGSATIVAKDNTKYTGEVAITITALPSNPDNINNLPRI